VSLTHTAPPPITGEPSAVPGPCQSTRNLPFFVETAMGLPPAQGTITVVMPLAARPVSLAAAAGRFDVAIAVAMIAVVTGADDTLMPIRAVCS
jgi:hypothetical protein